MTGLQTDALRRQQREIARIYGIRTAYEYRAAWRRGYDYLWMKTVPTGMGVRMSATHADRPPTQPTAHTKVYEIAETAARQLAEEMK